MATYSNSAREVEMPNGDVVVLHNAPTGGANTTSNIKKFKYDDNGHVTESTAANATDLNLNSYSTPTTGSTAIGTSDTVQTAIGKLDHQSQIDQSNILYVLGKTGHNLLEVTAVSGTVGGVNYTINKNSITISASGSSTTSTLVLNSGSPLFKASDNIFAISKVMPAGATITVRYTDGTIIGFNSANRNTNATLNNSKDVERVYIYIEANATISDTIDVMICTQEDWAITHEITPYQGIPNYDLTRLEAEDRASLAEVVDSGAKNLLQLSSGSATSCGITFSSDPNTGIVTVSGTKESGDCYMLLASISLTNFPRKFVAFCNNIDNAKACITIIPHRTNGTYASTIAIGTHTLIDLTNSAFDSFLIRAASYADDGVILNNEKIYPMLCTKAAFGVSKAFVPYRPNYDLVCDAINIVELDPTVFFTPATGYTLYTASNATQIWKQGKHIFGYIAITKSTGDFTDNIVGHIAIAYAPKYQINATCNFGKDRWSSTGYGIYFINTYNATDVSTRGILQMRITEKSTQEDATVGYAHIDYMLP